MSPIRVLGLAMVAVVVTAALLGPVGYRAPLLLAGAVVFAVSAGASLVLRRGSPLTLALLILAGVGALVMYAVDPAQVPLALFLLGAMGPLHRPQWAGLAAAGAVLVAFISIEFAGGRANWTLAATASGVVFFALVGRLLVRERAQRERIAQLLAELEESRIAEREASAQAERSRMARELHDVLAHTLSGLAIHLETARLLAAEPGTEPVLREAIDAAHQLSRAGLQEARRAVGALRGDELPGAGLLPALVEEHRLATGAAVRFATTGDPFPLAAEAQLTLYRTVQEALTNIRKHAPGASTVVTLDWGSDAVEIEVTNGAPRSGAPATYAPSSGFGLSGMRERAELLGARLETGATETGFRVWLAIPRPS